MNTTRDRMNWISASLSILMIIVYLAAPFYTIAVLSYPVSGYGLLSINLVAIVPVLLGVVVALGACIFPPIAAIITEAIHLLVMVLFLCMGNTIAASMISSGLNMPAEWAMSVNSVMSVASVVRPSWGAVVCMVLCVAILVIDIVVNLASRNQPQNLYVVGQDMDDPFSSGMF